MSTKKKAYPNAVLYSKNGVILEGEDLVVMKTGDLVFFSRNGEPFDYN